MDVRADTEGMTKPAPHRTTAWPASSAVRQALGPGLQVPSSTERVLAVIATRR